MRERMNQVLDSRPNRAEEWASACSRRDTSGDLHNQSHRVNCDALVASPTMRTLFLNASKTNQRPLRYAVLVAVVALSVRWLHLRRLQSDSRNLKDSALW